MQYISTRAGGHPVSFETVLFDGLAPDGGLYIPQTWPRVSPRQQAALAKKSYGDQALALSYPFIGDLLDKEDYRRILQKSLRACSALTTIPMRRLFGRIHLLELFHGPTCAFKDFALQFLGHLFDAILERRGETMTIIGATSGDTGSAAIAGCGHSPRMRIVILHPHERISPIQRRQMTTVDNPRVINIAIKGSFDDCQNIVKSLLADRQWRRSHRLGSINSINWARIMIQITYYFHAAWRLGTEGGVEGDTEKGATEKPISFCVPTGNFGNIFSAYAASRMGLAVNRLIAATNSNDVVARYIEDGRMTRHKTRPTLSPSMDISIPSNFERQLFESGDRDGQAVRHMVDFLGPGGRGERHFGAKEHDPGKTNQDGKGEGDDCPVENGPMRKILDAVAVDDAETLATIRRVREKCGILVDPHTAVGIAAAKARMDAIDGIIVCLATAHPAKFADALARAGVEPPICPEPLIGLDKRREHFHVLPANAAKVADLITSNAIPS